VDLIAMATHGRSGVREWALGSVAERVLRATLIPVLAFRGKPVGRVTIRRILVPLDGSEAAMEVLDPACEVAESMKAEVILLHVGKRIPDTVERAVRSVNRRGIPAKTLLRKGDPMKVILGTVQELDCDLIAMTPTGASQRDRIFFGSVAEEILKNVERPILIVRSALQDAAH
jgi:nucleotide-binding universal stress UspA family protein